MQPISCVSSVANYGFSKNDFTPKANGDRGFIIASRLRGLASSKLFPGFPFSQKNAAKIYFDYR